MIGYSEILNIRLQHEYYRNGKCNNTLIRPNEFTDKWIFQNGVHFMQDDNMIRLLAPSTIGTSRSLSNFSRNALTFNCFSNDPNFVNISNYPIDELGKFVFTSKSKEKSDDGLITLSESFQPATAPMKAVASLEIGIMDVFENPARWPLSYLAQIQTRTVPWKYYIIDHSNKYENFTYQLSGAGSDLFSGPFNTEILNSISCQYFDSNANLIPLKESNNTNDLNLVRYSPDVNNGVSKTIFRHMPNAGPESLTFNANQENQQIYSALYVYL